MLTEEVLVAVVATVDVVGVVVDVVVVVDEEAAVNECP